MKVLLVEDDERLSSFLRSTLSKQGYETTVCNSVEEVLKNEYDLTHDLVVLDLVLTGKRGDHLVTQLRKKKSNIPILVLSGLNQVNLKIDLLNLGVDDYMTKPFDPRELIARLQAIYRRYLEVECKDSETYGDIVFHWKQNKVTRGGEEIFLTQKEGELLRFLLQNRNKTVRNKDILSKVWQARVGFHSNVIQSTVRRLRQKVDKDFDHKLIRNVHGIGYMLVLPNDTSNK